ncbi:hypothetical protein ACJX0J_026727 [Zea mays]
MEIPNSTHGLGFFLVSGKKIMGSAQCLFFLHSVSNVFIQLFTAQMKTRISLCVLIIAIYLAHIFYNLLVILCLVTIFMHNKICRSAPSAIGAALGEMTTIQIVAAIVIQTIQGFFLSPSLICFLITLLRRLFSLYDIEDVGKV